ncbi:NAD kinase [Labilibacter marinus]|uniref:NAD kinase n=1 Tax=Labilibacter marinus TaxID=1477105 RepID=UPI0008375758|nr:NAD kinase [Labilibacter marinus]
MIKNIAMVGRNIAPEHLSAIEAFIETCYQNNIKVFIYDSLVNDLKHLKQLSSFTSFKDNNLDKIDLVVSVGGDGTFLRTARLVNSLQIPILGVNMGRLGFLAETGADELNTVLKELLNNEYSVVDRTVLSITEDGKSNEQYALNDITLVRRDTSSLIVAHVKVNGKLLNNYWSDGVIISTPTGSTAYSMSAGGPIVLPECNNIIITPIAPHGLNVRPLVLSDNVELEITVESRSNSYMLTVDSASKVVSTQTKVKIRKADYSVKVIERHTYDFFDTLRKKLMWGADIRKSNR